MLTVYKVMSLYKITKGMRADWKKKQAKSCTLGHPIYLEVEGMRKNLPRR